MNLDNYISKYIDGELTGEEDTFLRSVLTENVTAREKFDSAVNLHYAVREDADSIEPPEDVVKQTEDMILMRILAEQPLVRERRIKWQRSSAFVSFAVLLMFIFLFNIGDIALLKNNKSLLTVSGVTPDTEPLSLMNEETNVVNPGIASAKAPSLATRDKFVNRKRNSSLLANAENAGATLHSELSGTGNHPNENTDNNNFANDNLKTTENDNNASAVHNIVPAKFVAPSGEGAGMSIPENNSDMNNKPSATSPEKSKEKNVQSNALIAEKIKNEPAPASITPKSIVQLSIPDAVSENTEVRFSSFLGTDVLRTGINSSDKLAVTNFSQSIAYAVNNQERLGIEVGIIELGYKENVTISAQAQSLINKKTKLIENSDNLGPNGSNFVNYPFTYQYSKQMFWTSAFYERSLVMAQNLTLEGRLGFGMSDDGMLGYSRLFGMYRLFDGFSLTLGAEGKMFQAKLPGTVESTSLKSTAAVVYGLQFKF